MGIEKVLPRFADLEVMLQLLPRSSTAERMNPYTSLWTGVTPGDGPQEFHLVLLDAGRTDALADAVGRQALHCIRCSACLNVCPVYERTGGHAYESTYPGPIGAILTPQLSGLRRRHLAALGLVAVRRLLRGVPGQDRHPPRARAPARARGARASRGRAAPSGAAMRALARCCATARATSWRRAARPALAAVARRADRAAAARRRWPAGPRCATSRRRPRQTFREWWRERGESGVSSRELILGRIRSALADVPAEEPAAWTRTDDPDPAAAYALGGERQRETLLEPVRRALRRLPGHGHAVCR